MNIIKNRINIYGLLVAVLAGVMSAIHFAISYFEINPNYHIAINIIWIIFAYLLMAKVCNRNSRRNYKIVDPYLLMSFIGVAFAVLHSINYEIHGYKYLLGCVAVVAILIILFIVDIFKKYERDVDDI
jgi:uncharacterized membrane protein YfcA